MLHDCDALLGLDRRRSSDKWLALKSDFRSDILDKDVARELAILLATPGFLPWHHALVFGWNRRTIQDEVPVIRQSWQVDDLALENANSITLEDGEDYLHAMLNNPFRRHGRGLANLPRWSRLALDTLRHEGMTGKDLARRFGVLEPAIRGWWTSR
jgi:hypothetical protein